MFVVDLTDISNEIIPTSDFRLPTSDFLRRCVQVFVLVAAVIALPGYLKAQITQLAPGATSTTNTLNYTVPAGENRLLVISLGLSNNSFADSVVFGNSLVTQARASSISRPRLASQIWYFPLGSGDAITDTITVFADEDGPVNLIVATFSGIDQDNPLESTGSASTGRSSTHSDTINLETSEGNLIVDKLTTLSHALPVSNVTGSIIIGEIDDFIDNVDPNNMNRYNEISSYTVASADSLLISYRFTFVAPAANAASTLVAASFNAAPIPPTEPIPTLGEWGLITLSIMLMIFGVMTLRQRKSQYTVE